MKYIRKHKYLLLFLLFLLLFSIIFGIFLYNNQDEGIKNSLISGLVNFKDSLLNNHISNLFEHLIVISIIIILSFIFIGYLGGLFYYFYIGTSIGYTLVFLFKNNGFNGLIFGILYNIYSKAIFIILITMLFLKIMDLIKCLIAYIVYRKQFNYIILNIKHHLKNLIVLFLLIIINDLIIYFTSNFVLKLLIPML